MTEAILNEKRLDPRYIRRLVPDEAGGYTASIHEFPGCIAEGDTAEEALQNLEKAAASWIASAIETGYKVAEPLDFEGASGKIALRIPRHIHRLAAERAALEGTSLNQLISVALASYLGQQDGLAKSMGALKQAITSLCDAPQSKSTARAGERSRSKAAISSSDSPASRPISASKSPSLT